MKRNTLSMLVIVFVCIGGLFAHSSVDAATITYGTVSHFRDNRGPNNAGVKEGDRLTISVSNVSPNGYGGTTVSATQGTTTLSLDFDPVTTSTGQFDYSLPYTSSLDGVWNLTLTNGTNTLSVATPSAATAQPLPLVSKAAISPGPDNSHPTFTWTLPSGFTPDAIQLTIMDLTTRVPDNEADYIYSQTNTGSASSFTIPSTWFLQNDKPYCLEIRLLQYAPSTTNTLSRSRTFVDFIIPSKGTPSLVYIRNALWKYTDGSAGLWDLDAANNYVSFKQFGPYTGWSPVTYLKNSSGQGKLVWVHTSGMVAIWTMDVLDNYVSSVVYGPYTGWNYVSYKPKSLFWQSTSGQFSEWTLDGSDNHVSDVEYGPYTGWSPVDFNVNP